VKATISLRRALEDPALLGSILAGPSWQPWKVILIAAMGEVLRDDERTLFQSLTGRPTEPGECVDELWACVGRRGGKSRAAAVLATYLAALVDHSANLAIGERALVLLIAENVKQAGVVFGYVAGIFDAVPLLGELVVNRTNDVVSLTNGIDLEIRAANFRGLRGPTFAAAVCDEAAFWAVDGAANADTEILNAIRPGLATTGGPLVVISSPYAKRGEFYSTFKRHYGAHGDSRILAARGASKDLNPSLPQSVVDRALARDPAAAGAEYLAQFRDDVAQFVSREIVDSAVMVGRHELPPVAGVTYFAGVDPSGAAVDSYTLAIAHREGDRAVLDLVREIRPPFSPDDVTNSFAGLVRSYGVSFARGDHYAGAWPGERWRAYGVDYQIADKPTSDLYRDLLPLLNSRRVDLLDHPRLVDQICSLERRTGRGGRDHIDHGPNGHDDIICAVANALLQACPNQPMASWGIFNFFREEAAKVHTSATPPPDFGWTMSAPTQIEVGHALAKSATAIAANTLRLRPPGPGISQLVGQSGATYAPGRDGIFTVSRDDSKALLKPIWGDALPWREVA
jgi:hypothetical protein